MLILLLSQSSATTEKSGSEVENSGDIGTITIEDHGQVIELGLGECLLRGECDEIIVTIQDALSLEMFTGKNAEKNYTGLMKKLADAITKFEEGKYEDARDKLTDFQNKVVQLGAAGDIEQEYADSLVDRASEAITCVEAYVEGQ